MLLLFVLFTTARAARSWAVGIGTVLFMGGLAALIGVAGMFLAIAMVYAFVVVDDHRRVKQQHMRDALVCYALSHPNDPASQVILRRIAGLLPQR